MYNQVCGALVLLVFGTGVTVCQRGTETAKAAPVTAQEAAGGGHSQMKRLSKPDFISIRLAAGIDDAEGAAGGLPKTLKAGDRMVFRLLLTNNSVEPLEFMFTGTYSHYRPRLLKDGEVLPYRREIAERLQGRSEFATLRVLPVTVEPNVVKTEWFELSDFYKPLTPGRYELLVGRRFVDGGDWVDSESTFFEVSPK
jgi:hypothetical protein